MRCQIGFGDEILGSFFTGVDLAYNDLEADWPEGFEAGPTEDEEDEDVTMDADEDLPWPQPQLIRDWWSQNQSRFNAGTRYLVNRPISESSLAQILREGQQRQRVAAGLELALLEPDRAIFEVRARGDRQQVVLGK